MKNIFIGRIWKAKFVLLFGLFILFLISASNIFAQNIQRAINEEVLEGKIIKILEEKTVIQSGEENLYQKLEILVTKGSLKGSRIEIEVGKLVMVGQPKYHQGDVVLIDKARDMEGKEVFYISDFVRRFPLFLLALFFVGLVILVGRWRGAASLLGLAISLLAIFIFLLPCIVAGKDPILISIAASLIIIPSTFYTSHGLNKKTTVAILGTLVALIIASILSKYFIDAAKLTGFSSEEAGFLQVARGGLVNIKGLLLAGIMIGTLGVLDDVTVSQSAIVQQLKETNPKIRPGKLFSRAMDVGKDHISSMVNTLVLVYTGAAMPLLLLFIDSQRSFLEVVNYEIIAEEIIRALIGSICLISAVPITTFLATREFSKKARV